MKIHTVYQPKRKKPYVARWYEAPSSAKASGSKRRQRNRFFSTEEARSKFIEQFQKLAERQDPSLESLAPHQLIRWQQAMAIVPDADPVEVFKFWAQVQKDELKIEQRSLETATTAYIQSMMRLGRNHSYIGHVRRALADLRDEFGNKLVREFTGEQLSDYLFNLPYKPVTLRNRRNYLNGAFAWWYKQKWVNENPMKLVEAPKVPEMEPGILSVAETRQLFRVRHSFVTYHVALHRNPGKTALIISHRDQDCLYRHYLGIANQRDAKEYFRIFPRR